jgi:hypothetical protein
VVSALVAGGVACTPVDDLRPGDGSPSSPDGGGGGGVDGNVATSDASTLIGTPTSDAAGFEEGGTNALSLAGVAGTATSGKLDILFDVDNSASMSDKQEYLQQVIPYLIARLTTPNCVDGTGNAIVQNGVALTADASGTCASGQPQFAPINDLHLGVVTSSLGGRGTTNLCQTMGTPDAVPADYDEFITGSYAQFLVDVSSGSYTGLTSVSKNNDDEAHLINRTLPPSNPTSQPGSVAGDFLAWAPSAIELEPEDAVVETTTTSLATDSQQVILGAGSFGCGIESQMESWYRFLIQPDPYQSITTTTNSQGLLIASWSGVDTTILQQRADFLRPDSAVLIVVLSDESDSEIDVRTIGGIGVNWLDSNFTPPLPTTACALDPASPSCTSCAFGDATTLRISTASTRSSRRRCPRRPPAQPTRCSAAFPRT